MIKNYKFQGQKIMLETNKDVFGVSPFTEFFAENIKIQKGDSVIDVGTGSGVLAILAAKLGCFVGATDIFLESIDLAKKNAKLNNVTIVFAKKRFFPDLIVNFDVIIANLPQEVIFAEQRKKINPKLVDSSYGGKNGNSVSIELLKRAKKHMHKDSRLYMSIGSMCDFKEIFDKFLGTYDFRVLDFKRMKIKSFELESLERYKKLSDSGKIRIFKKGKDWFREDFFFEIKLKQEKLKT